MGNVILTNFIYRLLIPDVYIGMLYFRNIELINAPGIIIR